MDTTMHLQLCVASASTAGIVGGISVLFTACRGFDFASLLCSVAGAVVLALAHILRAAAAVQRSPMRIGPRVAVLGCFAIITTACALVLLGAGFGDILVDGYAYPFIWSVSLLALARLNTGGELRWNPLPRAPVHRRFASRFWSSLMLVMALATLCMLVSVCGAGMGGRSSQQLLAQFTAGIMVLLAAEVQVEAVQGCTYVEPTSVQELAEALQEPLASPGLGLGRWCALAALAHARQQATGCSRLGSNLEGTRGRNVGMSLVKELFSNERKWARSAAPRHGSAVSGTPAAMFPGSHSVGRGAPTGLFIGSPSVAGSLSTALPGGGAATAFAGSAPGLAPVDGRQQLLAPGASGSGGLFSIYLASCLEVIREVTVRTTCLVAAGWRKEARDRLLPAHISRLDSHLVELLPLLPATVAGLTGWVCLSSVLDERGVVQQEDTLQKLLLELCGALCAFDGLRPLALTFALSSRLLQHAESAQEEVKHSLQQLLLTFECAGLERVSLPPTYKRLIVDLSR